MIIDDEPIIVEGLSRSIPWENWDCRVVATAGDGLEARRLIEEHKPHMIFLDICMPEMNGLGLIAAIKSEHEDLEITILTGYRDFDYAQQAIRLGVSRFLLKPSNMEELEEAIGKMCRNLKKKNIPGEDAKSPGWESAPGEDAESLGQESAPGRDAEKSGGESAASSFLVKNAMDYIRENYTRKLTLTEVAEKTYVSQWHLSKLLNRHMGQSFSEILNRVRIERARELLNSPALRIGDIAEAVGFLDAAHFSRVFKKQGGISANEYRNRVLGCG